MFFQMYYMFDLCSLSSHIHTKDLMMGKVLDEKLILKDWKANVQKMPGRIE